MSRQWFKTQFPGVRYRKHPERKHGIKYDQFFTIRYKLDGRDAEEALGWASQGNTATGAFEILSELRRNQKLGVGPRTLAEKRALEDQARIDAEAEKKIEASRNVTWGEIWAQYIEYGKLERAANSVRTEKLLCGKWISPTIPDETSLRQVSTFHLEKIISSLKKADRAPRTIQYVLSVVQGVFSYAQQKGYEGVNPVAIMPKERKKRLKFDNRKMRFLTKDEAGLLLAELEKTSKDVHDQALLSLHAGLRAGEIFALSWADVDLARGVLTLWDTKNTKTRPAFLTDQAKKMLRDRQVQGSNPAELVFPARRKDRRKVNCVSASFSRAVKNLGLNDGIRDRRKKITFHSLRHTFASWLVENGTDLYVVKELLGHSDIRMTERYSHLGENTLQAAVGALGKSIKAAPEKVIGLVELDATGQVGQ